MAGLMTKHSGLCVDLRLEDRLLDLALEGVDVAIRVGNPPAPTADIVAHPLASFRRLLVASPAYLKRRGEPKTPEALAKHDALTYAVPGLADMWTLLDEAREASVRLNVVFRSNAPHAVRRAGDGGRGNRAPARVARHGADEEQGAARGPAGLAERAGKRLRASPDGAPGYARGPGARGTPARGVSAPLDASRSRRPS